MKKLSIMAVMIAVMGFGPMGYAKTQKKQAAKDTAPKKQASTVITSHGRFVSTMGGALVPLNVRMLDIGTGFPSELKVRYHIPILRKLELTPTFSFDYGIDTSVPQVGNTLGVVIKYSVYNSGNFRIAVAAEPGLRLVYYPGVGFGIQLGLPEVLMTYMASSKFALDFGLKIPIGFLVHPVFVASIPILFNLGAEFQIAPKLNALLCMDLGPDIGIVKGHSSTDFRANILMGVSYRF